MVRSREKTAYFENILKKPKVELIDDNIYKNIALNEVFVFNRKHGHSHSLADAVIREILKDINLKVNYLATFNNKDFKDLCDRRQIEII